MFPKMLTCVSASSSYKESSREKASPANAISANAALEKTGQRGVLQNHIPDVSPRMDYIDSPTVYHLATKAKKFTSKHSRTVIYSFHPFSTDFHPSPNSDLGLVT